MGLMGFVNLAHGVFAMAGGYFVTSLMSVVGVPFIPALLIAAAGVAVASLPFERFLYAPLYKAGVCCGNCRIHFGRCAAALSWSDVTDVDPGDSDLPAGICECQRRFHGWF